MPQDDREDPAVSVHTWIVVGDDPAIGNLITAARSLGGQVAAVVAGPRPVAETVAASDVDKVVWCGAPAGAPVEAYATAVADVIAAEHSGVEIILRSAEGWIEAAGETDLDRHAGVLGQRHEAGGGGTMDIDKCWAVGSVPAPAHPAATTRSLPQRPAQCRHPTLH